jgi:hypothetical protein
MHDDLARLMSKVVKAPGSNSCWEYQGSRDRYGYGRAYLNGKQTGAHRVAYVLHQGPIPLGLVIDHLCRNPCCVNPAHLEPVTPRENALRGISFSAINARKVTCIHGHSLTDPSNVYRQNGQRRQCRRCNCNAVRRYKMRRLQPLQMLEAA